MAPTPLPHPCHPCRWLVAAAMAAYSAAQNATCDVQQCSVLCARPWSRLRQACVLAVYALLVYLGLHVDCGVAVCNPWLHINIMAAHCPTAGCNTPTIQQHHNSPLRTHSGHRAHFLGDTEGCQMRFHLPVCSICAVWAVQECVMVKGTLCMGSDSWDVGCAQSEAP